jgi:hypothetical protein
MVGPNPSASQRLNPESSGGEKLHGNRHADARHPGFLLRSSYDTYGIMRVRDAGIGLDADESPCSTCGNFGFGVR